MLTLLGVGFAFLIGEIAVRLSVSDSKENKNDVVTIENGERFRKDYAQPNTNFVYKGQVGVRNEFEIHGRTNSNGFYDKEYSFQKAPNVFRIVIIGDSFVEALQLPLEKNFHKILETTLNQKYSTRKFEVIGLGRSGNGPRRNFDFLRDLGIKYKPNIVISEFLPGNDVRNDSVALQVLLRRQLEELKTVSLSYRPRIFKLDLPLLINSRLIQLLGQSIFNVQFKLRREQLPPPEQVPLDYFVYSAEYDSQWQRAWKATLEQILNARLLAEAHQSEYVLMNFGERFKIRQDIFDLFLKSNPAMKQYKWDFDHPNKIIRSLCEQENIKLLELEPLFQTEFARTNTDFYFEYDGHWNEAGHRYAAEKILQYLEREQLLNHRPA